MVEHSAALGPEPAGAPALPGVPAPRDGARTIGVHPGAWDAAGHVLGTVFGAVAHLRGTKPLHPQGAVLRARLLRHGARSGAAWIDTAGEDDVLVRLSRSAGLPVRLPDVQGLALRHDGNDLLLSATGSPPGLRHILRPQLSAGHGTFTSLLPFRGPRGPVMIGAQVRPRRDLPRAPDEVAEALREDPLRLRLVWAGLTGRWRPFGWLEIGGPPGSPDGPADRPVRFEPLRAPAGLSTYDWVARLREPSYTAARRVPADAGESDDRATPGTSPPDGRASHRQPSDHQNHHGHQGHQQTIPDAPPVPLGVTTTRRDP